MISKEEVGAILRRALDAPCARCGQREATSQGEVVDLDTARQRKNSGNGSFPPERYPTDHPVMLVRVLVVSLSQLRLLSVAMHEGWASQGLIDNLDKSIDMIEHVEAALRERAS